MNGGVLLGRPRPGRGCSAIYGMVWYGIITLPIVGSIKNFQEVGCFEKSTISLPLSGQALYNIR